MSAEPDWSVLLLAAGVVALVGWYFWFVIARTFGRVRDISRGLDARSATRRAAMKGPITREAPMWLRGLRVVLVATTVGLVAYLLAGKIEIR